MHYSSNKSKGYTPISSGPNRSGFYMGPQGNLLSMMQTGGSPTAFNRSFGLSAGGARLAQARQRQSDLRKLEAAQQREAKRQQKGGIFGSVGSLAGGLLGAALTPFAGPAGLAIGSGLGTALGKGLGERFGAGKAQSVDRSGTVFNQEAFKDVGRASKDFTKGILQRAGMAGVRAGLTAGLSPSGGIYGKFKGKLADPIKNFIGRTKAGMTGLSGFEGTGYGTNLLLDMAGKASDVKGAALQSGRGYGSGVSGGFRFRPPEDLLDFSSKTESAMDQIRKLGDQTMLFDTYASMPKAPTYTNPNFGASVDPTMYTSFEEFDLFNPLNQSPPAQAPSQTPTGLSGLLNPTGGLF